MIFRTVVALFVQNLYRQLWSEYFLSRVSGRHIGATRTWEHPCAAEQSCEVTIGMEGISVR